MKYIMEKLPDGNIVCTEIPENGTKIPIALLNQQIRMGSNQFMLHGHQVTYARYCETDLVTMIIRIPFLKWPTALKNLGTNRWQITNTTKKRDVYLKDVVLVTKQEAGRLREVYIISENGTIPQVTNIYDDGRICTGDIEHHDPQMMSPQELITNLENSPGNRDLCPNSNCSLNLEQGLVTIDTGVTSSNPVKYLKDRWGWK
jgi:hypothetical protein